MRVINETGLNADPLLSMAEVARQLSMSKRSIENWCRDGILPSVVIGPRTVRVRQSAVAALLRERTGWKPRDEIRATA